MKVGKRDVKGLVLGFGRGQGFWKMVHEEHENEAENQSDSNISMWPFDLLVRLWGFVFLFLFFRAMHTCMPLFMAFGGIVVATFLGLGTIVFLLFFLFFSICGSLDLLPEVHFWGPFYYNIGGISSARSTTS